MSCTVDLRVQKFQLKLCIEEIPVQSQWTRSGITAPASGSNASHRYEEWIVCSCSEGRLERARTFAGDVSEIRHKHRVRDKEIVLVNCNALRGTFSCQRR